MEILFIYLLSIIIATVAYGVRGFILGFLLGPLGTLFAFMFRGSRERKRAEKEHRELMVALIAAQKESRV